MGRYLNIGNAGFAAIRRGLYVDKTAMISFINRTLGTKDKLTCVSRPRRFGKSFAAQMLCAYYDKSCDSRKLFSSLNITQDASCEEHLNRYDVIYLDITEFTSKAFIKGELQNIVTDLETRVMDELAAAYPMAGKLTDLPDMLCEIVEATSNSFIFIIDEWDALFREAKEDTSLQESYIRLLRGLFKNSAKTDKMIKAAYITGILPIKKYGTQSAMTDFREYTMTQPEPLEQYVGFTEDEVRLLCESAPLSFEDMQRWYDGYLLGDNMHIYSPKSVMDAVARKRIGNYWTQSETYESLRLYM